MEAVERIVGGRGALGVKAPTAPRACQVRAAFPVPTTTAELLAFSSSADLTHSLPHYLALTVWTRWPWTAAKVQAAVRSWRAQTGLVVPVRAEVVLTVSCTASDLAAWGGTASYRLYAFSYRVASKPAPLRLYVLAREGEPELDESKAAGTDFEVRYKPEAYARGFSKLWGEAELARKRCLEACCLRLGALTEMIVFPSSIVRRSAVQQVPVGKGRFTDAPGATFTLPAHLSWVRLPARCRAIAGYKEAEARLSSRLSERLKLLARAPDGCSLAGRRELYRAFHFPSSLWDVAASVPALRLEAAACLLRSVTKAQPRKIALEGAALVLSLALLDALNAVGIHPTAEQLQAAEGILAALRAGRAETLLCGDVGSGKTVVFAMAAFSVAQAGGRVVVSCPSRVLAHQHLDFLQGLALRLGKSAAWVEGAAQAVPQADIYVGVLAVLRNPYVGLAKVSLVVLDEEHRLGSVDKSLGRFPEAAALKVSATPLPRSLASVFVGSGSYFFLPSRLDRSVVATRLLDQDEPGFAERLVSRLRALGPEEKALLFMHSLHGSSPWSLAALELLLQNEGLACASASGPAGEEANRLALMRFRIEPTCRVLLATSVLEVGVNVRGLVFVAVLDAHLEGASQLHQKRGRASRYGEPAEAWFCAPSWAPEAARGRVAQVAAAANGLEVAEIDLSARSFGALLGDAQAGRRERYGLFPYAELLGSPRLLAQAGAWLAQAGPEDLRVLDEAVAERESAAASFKLKP